MWCADKKVDKIKTKEGEKRMKKFFGEFKKFITRGNVLDMAVGIIIGGAFTAIVNALSNNILKPIINWLLALILGKGSLSEVYTFLSKAYTADGALDLANSIYIDWGAFINAIINFFLIALVLFLIIRTMNRVKEGNGKLKDSLAKGYLDRNERKELKENGISLKDRKAVKEYFEKKEELEKARKAEEEEKAKLEAEEAKKHTTEALLEQIKEILLEQANNKK